MAPPDTREMSPLCEAVVKAHDGADASLLAPHLSEDVTMVGLVGDHVGPAAVLQALFGSGEGRLCKPERALASCPAPDEAAGTERTYDMAIQSKALWPEQMYLDRFTVRDGKVVRVVRRTMTSVAGAGVCNLDGRDRYSLGGRCLSAGEKAERVCYTWAAERFLCTGFFDELPLPRGYAEVAAMFDRMDVEAPKEEEVPTEATALRAFLKARLTAL